MATFLLRPSYGTVHRVVVPCSEHWRKVSSVKELHTWLRGRLTAWERSYVSPFHTGPRSMLVKRCGYNATALSSAASPKEFTLSSIVGERCVPSQMTRAPTPTHVNFCFCSEIKFSGGKVALLADGATVVQVVQHHLNNIDHLLCTCSCCVCIYTLFSLLLYRVAEQLC